MMFNDALHCPYGIFGAEGMSGRGASLEGGLWRDSANYRKPSIHRESPGARMPMTNYRDFLLVRIRRARSFGFARICCGDILLSRCRVTTNHGQPGPKYSFVCILLLHYTAAIHKA